MRSRHLVSGETRPKKRHKTAKLVRKKPPATHNKNAKQPPAILQKPNLTRRKTHSNLILTRPQIAKTKFDSPRHARRGWFMKNFSNFRYNQPLTHFKD